MPSTILLISLGFIWLRRKELFQFFEALRWCPVWAILIFSFLLLLFRWEPPGSDPVKWGAFARIILETQSLPGDTRPITALTDLRGANLGLPILMALFRLPGLVTLDRIINFFECLTLAIFAFALASALRLWWNRTIALWAAILSMCLFTNPQQYLVWGGTPTLMGMVIGFFFFEWIRVWKDRTPKERELFSFALIIAFAAYAHPIGVYVGVLICGPLACLVAIQKGLLRKHLLFVGATFALASVFFLPFLWRWGFGVSAGEIENVRFWQTEMSPYLFRDQHSFLYNLYIQVSSYVWNTAFWISVGLFLLSVFCGKRKDIIVPFCVLVFLIVILVANVRVWWMPLSYLLYPERIATLLIFPFAMPLAWLIERSMAVHPGTKAWWSRGLLLIITLLAAKQVSRHTVPLLFASTMTPQDKEAIAFVEKQVPLEDCIKIKGMTPGMWIPVLAYRCTHPFHRLSLRPAQEEAKGKLERLKWTYFSTREKKPISFPGKVAFENEAQLWQQTD